ncbi:MAG: hypothetical protein R2800_14205 [Flavipsychrobacter sp.]
MKKYILFLSATALAITSCFSCKKVTDNTNVCKDVVCTYEFRSIAIKVTNKQGDAVKLDDFYTIRKSTGDTIRHQTSSLFIQDSYIVLNDSYRKKLENQRDVFQFVAIINGKAVIDQPFVIAADCCHIAKESGVNEITIN